MFQTQSNPPPALRPQSPDLQAWHLASSFDPAAQRKRTQRDMSRRSFAAMHNMFDDLIAVVARSSEQFAGYDAGLDAQARGTPHALMEATEATSAGDDERQFSAIAADLQTFTEQVREAVDATARRGAPASADLLSDVAQRINQYLWIVESHAAQT